MTRSRTDKGKAPRVFRSLLILATGAWATACAAPEPPPKLTASSTLLAAAESQSDVAPVTRSPFGDFLAGLVAGQERNLSAASDFMVQALESDPENLELMRRAFALVAADGRQRETLRLARRLVERDPRNAAARLALAVDATLRDDLDEVETHLAALPGRGLPAFYGPLLKGWVAVARGDLAKAVTAADKLSGREGFESVYGLHLALFHDTLGDEEGARAAYRRLLDQVRSPSLRLAWLAGNFFERIGDLEAAKEIYRRYQAGNPASTLLDAAWTRMARGERPAPVLSDYRQGWAEALFDLAGVLSQERADEMALIHVHLALLLKPDLEIGWLLIGEIFQGEERGEEAIAAYRHVDPASPLSWAARLRIAEELGRLERTEEAVAELEALAAERPDSFEPLYRIGNLLRLQERFDAAAQAYDKAIARIDEIGAHHWSLFYFRGIAREREGNWNRAERDFLKALELEPEQPYVMNYLAYSWIEQKQYLAEAQEMLVRAVELRPNDGYIVDSLGWVYYRLGQYEKAVINLERAVELKPQDPVINDHLGDAYWRVGRNQEARFQWRRALSFEPEADLVPTLEAKIKGGLTALPENI